MTPGTAKAEILRLLESLPDDASYEDIQYHLYVRQKGDQGLRDVAEGRVVTHDEVKRRMSRWTEK